MIFHIPFLKICNRNGKFPEFGAFVRMYYVNVDMLKLCKLSNVIKKK